MHSFSARARRWRLFGRFGRIKHDRSDPYQQTGGLTGPAQNVCKVDQHSHDGPYTGGELFSMRLSQDAAKRARDYAMPTDFCTVFNDHLDHLYTLSLLLTADHHKAEQCFVASLEDCLQGNPVFREWAQSWATRTVIKNAIRIISPSRNETKRTTENYDPAEPASEAGTPAAAITRLQPFDRFVWVMSVFEKYSDRECYPSLVHAALRWEGDRFRSGTCRRGCHPDLPSEKHGCLLSVVQCRRLDAGASSRHVPRLIGQSSRPCVRRIPWS